MTHIAGTIGVVTLDVPRAHVFNGYEIANDGAYCRRRLALTDAAQAEHGVANAVLRLHMPSIPDPSHGSGPLSALFLARPLLRHEQSRRLHGRADESLVLVAAAPVQHDARAGGDHDVHAELDPPPDPCHAQVPVRDRAVPPQPV